MKPIQIFLELVLMWVLVTTIYLFRNNYIYEILSAAFFTYSWLYYNIRITDWKMGHLIEDCALGSISFLFTFDIILGFIVTMVTIDKTLTPFISFFISHLIIMNLFNLRFSYLKLHPYEQKRTRKDNIESYGP